MSALTALPKTVWSVGTGVVTYTPMFAVELCRDFDALIERLPDGFYGWSLLGHTCCLLEAGAGRLKSQWAAALNTASLIFKSAAYAYVIFDVFRDLSALKNYIFSLGNTKGEKLAKSEKSDFCYSLAVKVEEAVYFVILLDTAKFLSLAPLILNRINFVASAAALAYNLIDLARSIIKFEKLEKKSTMVMHNKCVEIVKIEKTALHMIVDIMGILPLAAGMSFSLPVTAIFLTPYCVMSLWTNLQDQSF